MPRARVHARRDAPLFRAALVEAGAEAPPTLERSLLERHRAIDRNNELEDMPLHFMRGPKSESVGQALAETLTYLRRSAERAAERLGDALEGPGDPRRWHEAFLEVADAFHAVRDSYSLGHTKRAPGPGGPRVAAMVAWEQDKQASHGFGLGHVLRHDLRFEWPFSRTAPEVPASDVAVAAVARLIVAAALRREGARAEAFDAGWAQFVEDYFLPEGAPMPEKKEDLTEAEQKSLDAPPGQAR